MQLLQSDLVYCCCGGAGGSCRGCGSGFGSGFGPGLAGTLSPGLVGAGGADELDPVVPAAPGVVEPDVPGVAAPSHVLESIFTDVTRNVGPAAVAPAGALALPVGEALLLCNVPVISTR